MFSFLREAPKEDGTPGPLSMRRIAAAATLLASIGTAVYAMTIVFKVMSGSSSIATIEWKTFIPLFIPPVLFLAGTILLLLFTTWTDIKGIVSAATGKGGA
jgi:hypothetical protein